MHQYIDGAPLLFDLLKHRFDLGGLLNVQGLKQGGVERSGEVAHLAFKAPFFVGQIGDAQLAARGSELLGNAPGDRAVVGDPRNQGLFAA